MNEKLKVLLLEDWDSDAEIILRKLTKGGLEFDSLRVESRTELLDALREFEPHIILADYSLPQFTALDALRLLREQKTDVPLILVTGSQSEEVAVECIREGADDYILKDSLNRLPSALLSSLKKRETERRRAASETAFRRSEALYRLISQNTSDLVALLELALNCIYASPSHQPVLGYAPEELLGSGRSLLVHPEDEPVLREPATGAPSTLD